MRLWAITSAAMRFLGVQLWSSVGLFDPPTVNTTPSDSHFHRFKGTYILRHFDLELPAGILLLEHVVDATAVHERRHEANVGIFERRAHELQSSEKIRQMGLKGIGVGLWLAYEPLVTRPSHLSKRPQTIVNPLT